MPRFFVPELPLHIIQRGNDRQLIFGGRDDVRFYRFCLARAARDHGVAIHAYVFMSNHVHLLATPSVATSVPKLMQSIGRIYVKYFNSAYCRTGTLWEGRYKAAIVDDERYLLTCMRYIELNPVRAHIVSTPRKFPWSSFSSNAHGVADDLVQPHIASSVRRRRPAKLRIASYSDRRYPWTISPAFAMQRNMRGLWAARNFGAGIAVLSRRAERLPMGRPRKEERESGKSRV
jgi:putative transposase